MTKIKIFQTQEKVFSVKEFVDMYIDKTNLSETEKKLLRGSNLPDTIPEHLKKTITRAEWLKEDCSDLIEMRRAGERSAYCEKNKVKFKGCNPPEKEVEFPTELTFFGKEEVTVEKIPYGILTAEQVIREILGCVFFFKYGLNTNLKPVCVYSQGYGFCIVEETKAEKRVESFLDFENMNVSELVKLDCVRKKLGLSHDLGTEVKLKGINIVRYADEKAKILLSMNFNGGFRGLLNSNIGNDVITLNEDGELGLFLCDFDTFAIVDIPEKPTEDFLKRFFLQSFVELTKSSLPIVDIVEDATGAVGVYRKISSLFNVYRREFFRKAKEKGWDLELLKEIEEWAVSTSIFKRTVCEIVPTYEKIKKLPDREPVYRPH
jgi:hypothetical protein